MKELQAIFSCPKTLVTINKRFVVVRSGGLKRYNYDKFKQITVAGHGWKLFNAIELQLLSRNTFKLIMGRGAHEIVIETHFVNLRGTGFFFFFSYSSIDPAALSTIKNIWRHGENE